MAKQHTYLESLMKGVSHGGSRVMSSVSGDAKILKEIQASHAHDAQEIDVSPVLSVVEDIIHRANLNSNVAEGTMQGTMQGSSDHVDVLEEKVGSVAAGHNGTMLEALAVVIQKVCCEFSCKCTAGDANASTMAILNILGNYSWDAKVVITLAAFGVTYGELWLVILLGLANHPLAKSIAVLKQTPEISEINGVLKSQFAILHDLVKVIVDVSKSLIEFRLLPSKYISVDDTPLATSTNQIASATYWSIRSIVACGARITSNIGITSGLITSASEAWDLSSLVHKEKSIHDQLRQKLTVCYKFIEEKKREEAYTNLVRIFQTTQTDNLKNLKALIYQKTDIAPLVKVTTRQRVHVDVLKGKTIVLFISDLDDTSFEEIAILDKIYKESRMKENEYQYEIVWLPIVDKTVTWTREQENKFKDLQYKMSWYTLYHPALLDEVSVKFIKEQWGFAKKPITVALDPVAKVVNRNVLHMMLIWGNTAYPFTTVREKELWQKETWTLDFVMSSIHPEFPKWTAQGNTHICLFGGEDMEWIRKFTTSMKEHAIKTTGNKLELVYVGKHNAKEAVKNIMSVINTEKLAHTLPDLTQVWYFWTRLESMLYSKMHHGKNVDNDNIVKEVMSILSFDGGDQGWGFLGKAGSTTELVKGKGDVILSCFSQYKEWEHESKKKGVLGALRDRVQMFFQTTTHHCNRVVLPAIEGAAAPRVVTCADCGRPMEKYILYRCCTG